MRASGTRCWTGWSATECVLSALFSRGAPLTSAVQKRVGLFPKEKPIGKVAQEWQAALQKRIDAQKLETVDASVPFSVAVASKDDEELVSPAAMQAHGRRPREKGPRESTFAQGVPCRRAAWAVRLLVCESSGLFIGDTAMTAAWLCCPAPDEACCG